MSATTRTHSFQPTVESLEERSLMSAAPASPLTGAALGVLQQSYSNLRFLQVIPNYFSENPVGVGQMPAIVGACLNMEKSLQNGMNLLEQYENFYEALGYDGSGFRALDYYFRVIDQAVMQQAVADMQWYYAVCQGSTPGCGTNM
jgi:hypothetical protein